MDHQTTPFARRRLWTICWVLGVFALALALLAFFQNRRSQRQLEAIRKAGYPVTLAEWNKRDPPFFVSAIAHAPSSDVAFTVER